MLTLINDILDLCTYQLINQYFMLMKDKIEEDVHLNIVVRNFQFFLIFYPKIFYKKHVVGLSLGVFTDQNW